MDDCAIALVRELLSAQDETRGLSLGERRALYDRAQEVFAADVFSEVNRVVAGDCAAEWLRCPAGSSDTVVLYLHGGAYVLGSAKSHRHVAAAIGAASGSSVLVLDYRRAPESPFPAAIEDVVAAYTWLLRRNTDASRIVIAGDSAGGALTLSAMVSLRKAGFPLPAAGVCISPWGDLTCGGIDPAIDDPVLDLDELHEMAGYYLQGSDPRDPLASPVFADLTGLPPLLIQVGTDEYLREDARRLARLAEDCGVKVTIDEWPGMIHVWHWYFPILEDGRRAIEDIGKFVRTNTRAFQPER